MILLFGIRVLYALILVSVVLGLFSLAGLCLIAFATLWCIHDWLDWWRA